MDADKKVCNTFYETAKPTNLDSNLIKSECLKRTLDGLVTHLNASAEEEVKHDEKLDISPEISNKNTSPLTNGGLTAKMSKSFSVQAFNDEQDKSDVSKSMAFTIDFGERKQVDEQRHKSLLERFQNRHRRGVSLSKVDDEMSESTSSLKLKSPASAKLSRKNSIESPNKVTSASGVRMREKTKASQIKDASKRHSWSPRSSMVEPTVLKNSSNSKVTPSRNVNPLERALKMPGLTKNDVKPMPPTTLNITCLQPPLENRESHINDDQVSEAGTYTLDGDNYTEEQKEKMNIDKAANDIELLGRKLEINESDLEVIDLESPPVSNRRKNILEVSFYHQEPSANSNKQKVSYLEKLKSRVKNIGDKTFHKSKNTDSDMGTFTSVTTSGILSIKPTLDVNPHLKRKNSLTKSQIDSSEYVQGLSQKNESVSITDSDKTLAANYKLSMLQKQSPGKTRKESVGSSSTSISTAATKDDWIQEWARNAREFSRSGKRTTNINPMSNSYNFEGTMEKSDQFGYFSDDLMSRSDCKPQYEEFGDNLEKYHQKGLHSKKPTSEDRSINNLSDHEPLSLSSARSRRVLRDFDLNKQEPPRMSSAFNIKPPISPCRIPSPMGSVSNRQKRYGSNKMLYGSETDLTNDTELYLQRTAAAISTLQTLQRKNSLRNSSLQSSPVSPLSPTRPPQPKLNQSAAIHQQVARVQSVTRSSIHKRNSSLDSRYTQPTTHQNHAPYLSDKSQQHSRHNSYDGSQRTPIKYTQHFDQTDDDEYESMARCGALPERPAQSNKHQAKVKQSPIKRSSSFNIKPQEVSRNVAGTPKMRNKFTPTPSSGLKIQKSASSSCFKQINDDNDDYENEFYINDDDDLNPNQFTPSDSDEEQKFSLTLVNDQPIKNTRFNKTFLMRCEQSKSKVTGGKPLGVMACPNTPEMPRREVNSARNRDRVSMPRDSSLNRILDKKPASAGAVSSKSGNVGASGKVTSKYLDISKYKTEKGGNFLKRDESKSYLNREVKKSSSSACLQNFQRDAARASTRSSGTGSRPSSAVNSGKKKEVKNTKEIELAMWKRRASYDPLKAAAEGRRKAEEAKRLAQHQQMIMSSESNSSVMRSSKSYAAGGWIDDSEESEFDDEN